MPSVTLVYVHVAGDPRFDAFARRYVDTVAAHPGGHPCQHVVVCQGAASPALQSTFERLGDVRYMAHDNVGWDIGAFIAAASATDDDAMLCMGASAYVRRPGWLARFVDAWHRHGAGLYGSLSSAEGGPHLNTSGFLCPPAFLRGYPHAVRTRPDRYAFEHGRDAFWRRLDRAGEVVRLVTWDGVYPWSEWRAAPDISCRGSQANCLTYFRLNDEYDAAVARGLAEQQAFEARVDGALDPRWQLAELAEGAGALDDAIALYADLVTTPGRDGGLATYRMASLLERQLRHDESLMNFRRVIADEALSPDWRAGAAFHVGRIEETQQDAVGAIRAYRIALDHAPSHHAARAALLRLTQVQD